MRILGEHFNQNGKPKKAFSNKQDAALAANDYGKNFYKCTFCGNWHIGGEIKKKKSK